MSTEHIDPFTWKPLVPEAIENYKKLRDFLVSTKVPFDIRAYRSSFDGDPEMPRLHESELKADHHSCGTAGCAIGWAPFVVPPGQLDWYEVSLGHHRGQLAVDFNRYESKFSPNGRRHRLDWEKQWCWLFDGAWYPIDNTPQGVAFRLDLMLKGDSFAVEFLRSGALGREFAKHYADAFDEQAGKREAIEEYRLKFEDWIKQQGVALC